MRFARLVPFIVLVVLLVPALGLAQPGDPGGDPDVPLSGIEFLIGGGAILGLRRLLQIHKSTRRK